MGNSAHTERTLFGHPKGLFVLFLTEMWERFSFYGMRAILVLYIYSSVAEQGLGWSENEALSLYGWYTAFVYLMSIPGGIIADRFLGAKRSVMIGGALLCVGHWIMAIPSTSSFFVAIGFIVLGVGMLKPNISTMVGELYKELDARRERGFFIFYIGINLGALLATILVGLATKYFGWHIAFGLAGFGMLIGQLCYILGQKHLKEVGNLKISKRDQLDVEKVRKIDFFREVRQFFSELMENNVALIFSLMGISVAGFIMVENSAFLGVFLVIITGFVAYFLIVQSKWNKIEKNRVRVLFVIFLVIILFNSGFEQTGGLINIYTDKKIDRMLFNWEIPTGIFQGINSLFIIGFAGLVAVFWAKRRLKRKESSAIFKIIIGLVVLSFSFLFMVGADYQAAQTPFGKASMYWIFGFYLIATVAELCVQPVALSFITRLAPRKYASIMMGVFFAVTGLGNKLAGFIGESAHPEHIMVNLDSEHDNHSILPKQALAADSTFELHANIYFSQEKDIVLKSFETGDDFSEIIMIDSTNTELISGFLKDHNGVKDNMFHAFFQFHKDVDWKNSTNNIKGDGSHYLAELEIIEMESKYQYQVFFTLFALILFFGLLLILFVKPLKKLTHGAEDIKEPKEIEDKLHGGLME